MEDKSNILLLVAGLRKDVQSLISEVRINNCIIISRSKTKSTLLFSILFQ